MLLQNLLSGIASQQAGADSVLHCLRQSRSMQGLHTLGIHCTAMDSIAICICVGRIPNGKAHELGTSNVCWL